MTKKRYVCVINCIKLSTFASEGTLLNCSNAIIHENIDDPSKGKTGYLMAVVA